MNAELTLAIIAAIVKYGPSAVVTISAAMQQGSVTSADIKALFIDKEPEEYF